MDSPAAVRLAFVNASEAGVPDQPMASLLSVKGVSPNCPGGAHACGPHCSGRSTCEISWMSRPVRFRAANVSGGFFPYRQRSRSLGGSELVGQNSGRERNSLIRAEISLIADLNSLQGRKKFPVRMRRELARKVLI